LWLEDALQEFQKQEAAALLARSARSGYTKPALLGVPGSKAARPLLSFLLLELGRSWLLFFCRLPFGWLHVFLCLTSSDEIAGCSATNYFVVFDEIAGCSATNYFVQIFFPCLRP
jgi:phosphatidylglycerophosphatase A